MNGFMKAGQAEIQELISNCRSEDDMDSKVFLFNLIRKLVADSTGREIKTPSLVTDDFINSALDRIRY
ncbi:MAG: hypothetical protein MN733_41375 [Nitrososphaera sp.]|nr:hypothetical protein [Nitrososphaera sp.]